MRQRRNKTTTAAELPAQKPFTPPKLPKRDDDDPWHDRTVAWWDHVWRSPMAGEYLEVDADGLLRLAELIDQFNHDPRAEYHSEIRLHEKRFGLTPMDRHSLQWQVLRPARVVEDEEITTAQATARQRRTRKKPKGKADPRKLLPFQRSG